MARVILKKQIVTRKRTLLKAGLSIFLFFQITNPCLKSATIEKTVQSNKICAEAGQNLKLKLNGSSAELMAVAKTCK